MRIDDSDLFQLASRLGLAELSTVARGSGVISVLQVAVYQGGRRLRHSVARVVETQLGAIDLTVAYEGVDLSPLRMTVNAAQFEKLQSALDSARFGRLGDQPGLSRDDAPLWLVQRAAGTHLHGIILAPNRPALPWSRIVNAIDACIPAAVREVPFR